MDPLLIDLAWISRLWLPVTFVSSETLLIYVSVFIRSPHVISLGEK